MVVKTKQSEKKVADLAKEIIKKIPNNKRASSYEVVAGAFNDSRKNVYLVEPKDIEKKFKGSVMKNACFNNSLRQQLNGKTLNRVYAGVSNSTATIPKFTPKEKRRWIELAKKHNFLPEYVKETWADKGEYVFNLSVKDMSPSLLYAYLSMIRYPRDEPAFAKSIMIMVDHGVNYYIAFALASRMYIENSGHHVVNAYRGYPYRHIKELEAFRNVNLEVGVAVSLKRYFDNPGKWDKRSVFDAHSGWNCHAMIRSAVKTYTIVKASELFDPSIVKIVMSDKA